MTKTRAKEDADFASVSGGAGGGGVPHPNHATHHHHAGSPSALTREALLEAYKSKHKELKESKKTREKQVIIENVRRRAPQLLLKSVDHRRTSHSHHNLGSEHAKEHTKEKAGGDHHKANRFVPRFSVLIPQQFKRPHGQERPEGWAAARISKAMRRYFALQMLTSTNAQSQYLATQCKKLFDECCKCSPLAHGPSVSESGVYQLAGPNLPRILRIIRSKKNLGMDLLQHHGVAKYTVTHVAAQRGYVDLTRELLLHWTQHPMESPNQPYSIKLLRRLLALVLQLRDMKTLVSESNSELRDVIARIGVSFAHFSDALDKLHDRTPSLEDLLVICGHPLVLCKDASGNTPLHYAAEGGYLSLCQLLIEKGANINAQNKSGETPLHFAISSMHEGVCTYLVQNKADVSLCRYVTLTLLNDVSLPGTFVDVPDSTAVCKVMPIIQTRSAAPKPRFLLDQRASMWVSPWRSSRRRVADMPDIVSKADATVSPQAPVVDSAGPTAEAKQVSPHIILPISGSLAEDGMFTRVDSLSSSPLFRKRSPRDIVFFRTAPGNALIKPNILCVLLIGDHVSQSEVTKSREIQQRGKLFHLLIQNLPQVAVVAMDSFRTPLFRCSMQSGVREYKQRWIVDNKIKNAKERRQALLVAMKGQKKKKKRRRLAPVVQLFWKTVKMFWKTLRRLRRFLSIQNVFSPGELSGQHKENIICEPKGIVYEYVYDDAEFRGGASPTLSLIVETECKDLIDHPWFGQLMDHKWNSFARDAFRRDFHIYFVYFVAVFVATYLHVGDTLVGMPVGGYRSKAFTYHASWPEYVRDGSRLIYSVINAYYTVQEFRSYLERGSLRAYFQDGWNWFDLVQITCVWLLLATELRGMISDTEVTFDDYELHVFIETYYSWTMWRTYNLRTTLMSIVGPQIFIKWIQFARGNRTLGPFVRMIFKMFKDIGLFLVVFCVFLLGFAFAFFILQLEGTKTYFGAITMVLQISLGAWDWDAIYEGGPIAIIFFILYAIIGTIMLLNLLIAMLGNTYDKIWEDRLLFFELERAKATLSIQNAINDDEYDEHFWSQRLYVMEGDKPIEGIQSQKF